MRKPGISQQAELFVQRLFVWISRLLPFRPVVQLKANAPDRGYARTRRSHVHGLGTGKLVWVKVLVLEPEGPEDAEDFALGVQPRMSGGAGLAQGSLIKVPEGTGTTFGGLQESPIADGLQDAIALTIQLFKAQWFVVTGTVANAQAAVLGEAGEFGEAVRVLDIGDKEMGADQANARSGAEALDLREESAGLTHETAGLGLASQRLIQERIEQQRLGTQGIVRQLLQPTRPASLGKDDGPRGKETPMLEEGFELELEAGLAQDRVFVGLGGALEEDALIVGGLPDGPVFVEAQEAGQREGVAAVMLVGILADEAVAAGITNDELLDMRLKELGDPTGEIGFFEHEAFDRGRNGLDLFEELPGIRRETPVINFVALIVELSQHAISGVGIQAEPCYRRGVSHSKPLVMVALFNNLADACRIRICSFSESHNCSVQQIVRFSIYQQATRDGRFRRRCAMARQASSASRAYSPVGPRTFTGFTLVRLACLSMLGRKASALHYV